VVAQKCDVIFTRTLSLNEKDDRWYMGAGPTVKEATIFGYIARPSFGDDDLATAIEMMTI